MYLLYIRYFTSIPNKNNIYDLFKNQLTGNNDNRPKNNDMLEERIPQPV